MTYSKKCIKILPNGVFILFCLDGKIVLLNGKDRLGEGKDDKGRGVS
jgi:hypothetical protein